MRNYTFEVCQNAIQDVVEVKCADQRVGGVSQRLGKRPLLTFSRFSPAPL